MRRALLALLVVLAAPATALAAGEVITINGHGKPMWVTIYYKQATKEIREARCVLPNQSFAFASAQRPSAHWIRAEMTRTKDCASLPGNRHVDCDTEIAVPSKPGHGHRSVFAEVLNFKLLADPQRCWWVVIN